jgi:hypothetical protein
MSHFKCEKELCAVVSITVSICYLLFPGIADARAARSDQETLYYSLAHDPKKGITRDELINYLRQQVHLDPLYKELHTKGDKIYESALEKSLPEQADLIIVKFSSPGDDHLDLIAFSNYLAVNPRKSDGVVATPAATPKGLLDTVTYNPNTKRPLLSDKNLHITKSAPNPGASTTKPGGTDPGPAQFNWTRSAGSRSLFSVDAAISYSLSYHDLFPPRDDKLSHYLFDYYLTPSFEAHTATDPKNKQDSLQAKLQLQIAMAPNTRSNEYVESKAWFADQIFSIAPSYQRDTVKKIEAYGGEIFYTPIPNIPGFKVYKSLNFWRKDAGMIPRTEVERELQYCPEFLILPAVGIETGYYANGLNALPPGLDKDYTRLTAKLHLDFYITPQFDIATDYVHRTFLVGGGKSFDYVEVSPVLYLDPTQDDPSKQHFALGMSFKYGKTTPQFQEVRSISAWFGVKF